MHLPTVWSNCTASLLHNSGHCNVSGAGFMHFTDSLLFCRLLDLSGGTTKELGKQSLKTKLSASVKHREKGKLSYPFPVYVCVSVCLSSNTDILITGNITH